MSRATYARQCGTKASALAEVAKIREEGRFASDPVEVIAPNGRVKVWEYSAGFDVEKAAVEQGSYFVGNEPMLAAAKLFAGRYELNGRWDGSNYVGTGPAVAQVRAFCLGYIAHMVR